RSGVGVLSLGKILGVVIAESRQAVAHQAIRSPVKPQRSAVVLLSGGLDSAVALACARAEGFECHAISFDYGQRHGTELDAAARVAESLGIPTARRVVVKIDLRTIGGSALTSDAV